LHCRDYRFSFIIARNEHGIIHRDLKTDNIVVTPDDRVKILDFGLAEHFSIGDLDEATMSHSAVSGPRLAGTILYMAPEVLHGNAAVKGLASIQPSQAYL
jgi:serine/threonine-protein kinase